MKQVKSILKRALKHGFDLSGIKNYNLEKFKDGLFEHLVNNKYYVFEEDESLFVGYFAYEDTAKVYFYETFMKVEPIQESGFFEILIELFRYISIAREESMIEKDLDDDETTEDYSAEDSDSESEELWL
jgi:hypothetical protein